MARSNSTSLWRPANLLMSMGILAMKGMSHLPMPVLQAIGKILGAIAAIAFPYRKHVGMVNLRLCFPEISEGERRKLLFRHYQAMGMGVFELAAGWYKPRQAFERHMTIRGAEHLEAVRKSGRGALLMTAHFTTLEIVGRILLDRYPISCLYRKPDQPVLAKEMTARRHFGMKRIIHFDEMHQLIRALREGDLVWYAPDQGKRLKYSAVLPFFGEPAVTNTATGRIAKMGRAAILPFMGIREPDGHYTLEILPEIEGIPSDDPEADAIAINTVIEQFIRRAPEQYFWLHKRFKRRGPGYPDVYAKEATAK